jgi:hypothetical protein
MAGEEPVGDLVDDVAAVAAEAIEAVADAVDEGAERRGEVAAMVPLEVAPLALLGVELGAIPRQPDDVQPPGPLGEGGPARAAGVAGAVVQDEVDLLAQGDVPTVERLEVAGKGRRVLRRLEDFYPPASERLDAAEDSDPSVRPDRRHGRLVATPVPDPTQVGIRLDVGLVLVVQLKPVGLGGDLFPPPPPTRPRMRRPRRGPAGA